MSRAPGTVTVGPREGARTALLTDATRPGGPTRPDPRRDGFNFPVVGRGARHERREKKVNSGTRLILVPGETGPLTLDRLESYVQDAVRSAQTAVYDQDPKGEASRKVVIVERNESGKTAITMVVGGEGSFMMDEKNIGGIQLPIPADPSLDGRKKDPVANPRVARIIIEPPSPRLRGRGFKQLGITVLGSDDVGEIVRMQKLLQTDGGDNYDLFKQALQGAAEARLEHIYQPFTGQPLGHYRLDFGTPTYADRAKASNTALAVNETSTSQRYIIAGGGAEFIRTPDGRTDLNTVNFSGIHFAWQVRGREPKVAKAVQVVTVSPQESPNGTRITDETLERYLSELTLPRLAEALNIPAIREQGSVIRHEVGGRRSSVLMDVAVDLGKIRPAQRQVIERLWRDGQVRMSAILSGELTTGEIILGGDEVEMLAALDARGRNTSMDETEAIRRANTETLRIREEVVKATDKGAPVEDRYETTRDLLIRRYSLPEDKNERILISALAMTIAGITLNEEWVKAAENGKRNRILAALGTLGITGETASRFASDLRANGGYRRRREATSNDALLPPTHLVETARKALLGQQPGLRRPRLVDQTLAEEVLRRMPEFSNLSEPGLQAVIDNVYTNQRVIDEYRSTR